MKKSHNLWLTAWYRQSIWIYLLLPVSWLFFVVAWLRKFYLVRFSQRQLSVPIIVVGNISVGGTGKTPLIIELVKYLQQQGYQPGVVSRGYGGRAPVYPYVLNNTSTAFVAGDEPLLIFRATGCAVCVAPDRVAAAQQLITAGCNIILSDDGLQHYRLGRSLEIAVVDGQRLFGNQQLLPAGPLREPVSRLASVDMVVVNNPAQPQLAVIGDGYFAMHIIPKAWRELASQQLLALDMTFGSQIHAVAGIGNPERFFKTLDSLALHYYAHCFPDHYVFSAVDFENFHGDAVVMTEKDAVKCQSFAQSQWYALVVGAALDDCFWKIFQQKIELLKGH